ncbi:MAG TPA: septum site-determining protein MinC [Burkholderiaceae bacterium]|nr:septum site-determining protein MinC [Burkholderiaceae bacterium]
MAVAAPAKNTSLLELRSAALTLVAVVLKTTDLSVLARELGDRVAATPGLFDRDPVAVDLSRVREACEPIDFGALVALLRSHHLVPVAARGGSAEQMAAASAAGLAEAPDMPRAGARSSEPLLLTESIREVMLAAPPPLLIDRPLRSGQQVYARGTDLIVLALVSYGAEVIADGSIHVYAPLRGRALAGVKGATSARIYTTCMQAQLLSIAGTYRTGEAAVPAPLDGRPAMARLDGDALLGEPLSG